MLPILLNGQYALFALILLALIVSLSFHEFGHAYAAKKFGDPTAEKLGRLTINPIAHIDPIGLLMVILVGFGYAKPVPTNPRNFNSKWAQFAIAAAGPLANLLIAMVAWNLWLLANDQGWTLFTSTNAQQFFMILVMVNLILMVFNLIPIGPLDGHYILPYFLPEKLAASYTYYNARYGHYFFLALILIAIAGVPIFTFVRDIGLSLIPFISFF